MEHVFLNFIGIILSLAMENIEGYTLKKSKTNINQISINSEIKLLA